jgi:hypothetical protein
MGIQSSGLSHFDKIGVTPKDLLRHAASSVTQFGSDQRSPSENGATVSIRTQL